MIHAWYWTPLSSPTIVGRAGPRIDWSSAARNMPAMRAPKMIQTVRGVSVIGSSPVGAGCAVEVLVKEVAFHR